VQQGGDGVAFFGQLAWQVVDVVFGQAVGFVVDLDGGASISQSVLVASSGMLRVSGTTR